MAAISQSNHDLIAKLVPGGVHSLAHLDDQELLKNTRRLVGRSNQLFAALLLHLAEVEARGLHRKRLCASLYTYCIYELRFSEDAAARRSSAARLVKQFPLLFDAIANGELHLTGLLMLGPHLTPENHVDVLGRAKFRTKKELAKLVRELSPLPQVPDLIEPLRPDPTLVLATTRPSWERFASSFEPPVRDLRPGERPREWANDDDGVAGDAIGTAPVGSTLAPGEAPPTSGLEPEPEPEPELLPAAPAELPPITGPQQYQMQFTTSEEHVQLVERAKALLARERPGLALGEVHLEAMKMLVAALEKRKFAVTDRPQTRARAAQAGEKTALSDDVAAREAPAEAGQSALTPRQRGRYVPAAERREVFERDGGRCSYADSSGARCRETRYLELHHLKPFAQGGANLASNLTLRCAAHNALAAEEDFGREYIQQKRGHARHESLAVQTEGAARGSLTSEDTPNSG
jgi:5-methylcytosine-specific restriction endonuclease McrA